jgi:pimeloyl-ACP methyl ester carboxylesterase
VPSYPLRKFLTTNLERTDSGAWRWLINLPALTAALPTLEKNPLTSADRFAGRSTFIAGGRSTYIEPADHSAIRHHFPAARIETFAESGHNPHMKARAAFVAAVLRG